MGIIGRDLCCRCISREKERAAKQPCPQCGSDRVLTAAGCCIACSRRCTECGQKLRTATATLCKTCRRRAEIRADLQPCPRCSRPGHIKATTGWCGPCSRPRPPKDPPRICSSCGALRRHRARGMCSRCLQRDPSRAYIAGDNLASRLGDPPEWLAGFVVHLAGAYSPARATTILTELGRLLADEHPTIRNRSSIAPAGPGGRWGRWPDPCRFSSLSSDSPCRPTMPNTVPQDDVIAVSKRYQRPYGPPCAATSRIC